MCLANSCTMQSTPKSGRAAQLKAPVVLPRPFDIRPHLSTRLPFRAMSDIEWMGPAPMCDVAVWPGVRMRWQQCFVRQSWGSVW